MGFLHMKNFMQRKSVKRLKLQIWIFLLFSYTCEDFIGYHEMLQSFKKDVTLQYVSIE